jgi:hypothetical protein
VATVFENRPDRIHFVNVGRELNSPDAPALVVQAGEWEIDQELAAAGVVFDTYGKHAPLLLPADARKLAKWLTRAADALEGVKHHSDNKKGAHNKTRRRHEDDDDDLDY